MMWKTLFAICCGLTLSLAAPPLSAQEGSYAERLFEKLDHDFGVVARGAEARHRLKLVNSFPDPVHISSIRPGCECISVKGSQDTILPGGEAYIEFSLDTKKFKHQKDTTVLVTFDRPHYAQVKIPVKGYIRTDVVLTPGEVEFGAVAKGIAGERKVAIAYAGRSDWKIKEVICKNKDLEAQLHEVSRNGGNVNYELTVALKSTAPAGELREQLVLITDDSSNPRIPLLVGGKIESDYFVVQPLVDFGTLAPGARKTVNVLVRGKKSFLIEKIESEKTAGVFEVVLPKDARDVHRLPLTVIAPQEATTLREEFTITIEGVSDPVVFRAQCKVVPATAAR
ncbi:MAG: DUF1573 domain-containing protein [Planctomycetales bacterium]